MQNSTNLPEVSPVRFFQFALAGASGLLVNALVLALATERLGIFYLWSAILATLASTTWNFTLSELWVFRDRQRAGGAARRFALFFLLNNLALLVRGPILWGLTAGLGLHYQLSNLVSIGIMTVARYLLANHWIWRRAASDAFRYNIYDLVTISSTAPLPELALFRTTEPIANPTISLQLGLARLGQPAPPGVHRMDYDEGLGALGFRARIDLGERIEVLASPLLGWSPHVLYTNLVEPILRWTLVEKGHALIHGACLAVDERAYLVTARTDTGKTTTLLQLLRNQGPRTLLTFVADDLTLVSPEGWVRPYPKPLTISAHTAKAISATCLAWHERLFLPLQSRIHSRGGRVLAHWLARTRLPMATINAYIQCLVPPPKYFVQQLVPGTRLAAAARLSHMFVIERAAALDTRLPPDEALTALLRNCEDAYGFPPYATLAPFLHQARLAEHKGGLVAAERAIIASALDGVPTTLLRRPSGDWWPGILLEMEQPVPTARAVGDAAFENRPANPIAER